MSAKTKNTVGWILTALLTLVFIGSAFAKFSSTPEFAKNAVVFGLTADKFKILGIIEILSVLLFIFPRTGLLGTLLLAAYLGGAIATHLEHQQAITAPFVIECLVWITATIRFPELSSRLTGKRM